MSGRPIAGNQKLDGTGAEAEKRLLETAEEFSFRGRMDKITVSGPILSEGRGTIVRDIRGKEYLDFNSGQMCAALGHNHPRIVNAIKESCDTLIHASSSYYNVKEIELAKRVADIVPRPLKKSMFLGSGADSNEAAITIAKKFTGGFEVASPHVSFHGMSEGSRTVTFAGWHKGYGALQIGSYAIMAPYCYRCPVQHEFPKCEFACLKASLELLDAESTGNLAAIITEPLFSAGGVIEPPPGWFAALKKACEDRGILLIYDEAQTGLGKLGTMFACQQEGVIPDILTISKHFGGGVEISAVVTTPEIEEKVVRTGMVIGHSHTNDPLACNAGIATIDILVDDNLPARAKRVGEYWQGRLRSLQQKYEIIGDVRGRGLIHGVEFVRDRESRQPFFELGKVIAANCLQDGLIFSVRRNGSVIRFVPQFYASETELDRAAEIFDRGIKKSLDQVSKTSSQKGGKPNVDVRL